MKGSRAQHIDEPYLQFLREQGCCFCPALAPSDPSHLCSRGWREPRRDDRAAVPHCRRCHNEFHQLGPAETMRRHGLGPLDLALVVVDLHRRFAEQLLRPEPPL